MNASYVRHALYIARGYSTEHIAALDRDRAARRIGCEFCGARPLDYCTNCGRPRSTVHPSRLELAR